MPIRGEEVGDGWGQSGHPRVQEDQEILGEGCISER